MAVVTSQLGLDLGSAPEVPDGEPVECRPGQELTADMAAITTMIPWFGKRANTARQSVRRPIAYLYGRPALMDDADATRCYEAARGLVRDPRNRLGTGKSYMDRLAFERGFASTSVDQDGLPRVRGDYWVRVSGEKEGVTARDLVRRVQNPIQSRAPWMLEVVTSLGNDAATERAAGFKAEIRLALRVACPSGPAPGVFAAVGIPVPHLAPLVLAVRWDDALQAAVILARHGVLPGAIVPLEIEIPRHSLEAMFARHGLLGEPAPTKSISTIDPARTWDALVDAAFGSGQPWAERLHGIGKLQPSSSVARALRWVSEQPR